MYNKVNLIGHLGKDPEITSLDETSKVARFTIATNENYKDRDGNWREKTEWHNIVAWRGLADKVDKKLKIGMLVFVEGKITYRKYQDKEGVDRYITDIVAYTIKPLEKNEKVEPPTESTNFPTTDKVQEKSNESSSGEKDDDLPF